MAAAESAKIETLVEQLKDILAENNSIIRSLSAEDLMWLLS